jgi:hypothetical protein
MTTYYSVPDPIEKLLAIYDGNAASINFNQDKNLGVIWFDSDPTLPLSFYGTPNKVTSNISAILDVLDEDYEDIIWQYIRANVLKQAHDESWKEELDEAEKMVKERRQYRNRDMSLARKTLRFKDREGRTLDDGNNTDGYSVDISDSLVVDDL